MCHLCLWRALLLLLVLASTFVGDYFTRVSHRFRGVTTTMVIHHQRPGVRMLVCWLVDLFVCLFV